MKKQYGHFIAAFLYILATLLANLTVDKFIPIGPTLLSVGTIFFGVTFTQRDRMHPQGRAFVYSVILLAAGLNVIMALIFQVPWRFIAASFFTILISESADTEVYQRLIKQPWLIKSNVSNIVSVILDSTVFTILAFAGELEYTVPVLISIILGDLLYKWGIGFLLSLYYQFWNKVRHEEDTGPIPADC